MGQSELQLVRIEQEGRLVVLARALRVQDIKAENKLRESVLNFSAFGNACVGRALYRHNSIFRGAAEVSIWSHLELSYFRNIIPAEVVHELVFEQPAPAVELMRAEVLVSTPSAFLLPKDWQGAACRPEYQASIEYIDVRLECLSEYREIMRKYIGPAAAKRVEAGGIGTFRAMETAAVLYRNPGMKIDWNQIHLCELNTDGFDGFGRLFDVGLRELAPESEFVGVFAGLDRMRTVPLWTFNNPVVEADVGLVRGIVAEP